MLNYLNQLLSAYDKILKHFLSSLDYILHLTSLFSYELNILFRIYIENVRTTVGNIITEMLINMHCPCET